MKTQTTRSGVRVSVEGISTPEISILDAGYSQVPHPIRFSVEETHDLIDTLNEALRYIQNPNENNFGQ